MKNNSLFKKKNYNVMIIGLIFIGIGFILMSGGDTNDETSFNEEIFNFRRITIAPIIIIIGFIIEVFAIMLKTNRNPNK
ncbi:MAG: DUF3098 domain-containing protein [Flavobacteriales bacterium TMED288]|nr:hypothetical protein [Flavobacteriales bacterium]MAJ98495.1 hypothetical protein [Flavobacteriales bacterium]RPG53856.1 MAG: DUF3098 domain-containing protein [Flavobacteriales bacterium TMED288]|tara:strand:+ start:2584 stop:2820 length:237 start_codon:yes stop_codon:yes gene_type:complete